MLVLIFHSRGRPGYQLDIRTLPLKMIKGGIAHPAAQMPYGK
jgi:hypothetical protein